MRCALQRHLLAGTVFGLRAAKVVSGLVRTFLNENIQGLSLKPCLMPGPGRDIRGRCFFRFALDSRPIKFTISHVHLNKLMEKY